MWALWALGFMLMTLGFLTPGAKASTIPTLDARLGQVEVGMGVVPTLLILRANGTVDLGVWDGWSVGALISDQLTLVSTGQRTYAGRLTGRLLDLPFGTRLGLSAAVGHTAYNDNPWGRNVQWAQVALVASQPLFRMGDFTVLARGTLGPVWSATQSTYPPPDGQPAPVTTDWTWVPNLEVAFQSKTEHLRLWGDQEAVGNVEVTLGGGDLIGCRYRVGVQRVPGAEPSLAP